MEIKIREDNKEWAVDMETPDQIQSIYFKSRQNALSFVKYLELADNVALDLITRQQAKIDEFMKETAVTTLLDDAVVYTPTLEDYNKFKKKFKSEAAKEFAEKIKEFMHNKFKTLDEYEFEYITESDIGNLLKEMVGENNATT